MIATHNNKIFSIGGNVLQSKPEQLLVHAWYRADAVEKDSNNFVSKLIDLSGNGNDCYQSTQSAKPLFVATDAEFNNQPSLSFNGTSQFLNGGDINNIGKSNFYVWVVGRANSGARAYFAKSLWGGIINRYGYYQNEFLFHGTSLLWSVTNTAGVKEIILTRRIYSTGSVAYIKNGVTVSTGLIGVNVDLTSVFMFLIGGYNNSSGTTPPIVYHSGRICEIIIVKHPTELSDIQIQSVTQQLNSKYAIF